MNKKVRVAADCALVLLLPLLMAYSLVGEVAHEYLGIVMALLFVIHHWVNATWWKNLFRSQYSAVRILGIIVNLLLAVIMAALPISGMMMSRHTFSFLNLNAYAFYARTIHLLAAYWGFVLMSFHAGLHGKIFLNRARKAFHISTASKYRTRVLRIAAGGVSAYGAYAFIHRQLADYMFLKIRFVFLYFSEPLIFFIADYISIMLLFALIGYYLLRLLQQGKK